MPSKINFSIKVELYRSNTKIKINDNHIKELEDTLSYYSRRNSENEIISYELGIIKLNNKKITIDKNTSYLNFEFDIDININDLHDAEEAIWCIFEPAYSLNGIIDLTIDGTIRRQYYTLKLNDVPNDIKFTNY